MRTIRMCLLAACLPWLGCGGKSVEAPNTPPEQLAAPGGAQQDPQPQAASQQTLEQLLEARDAGSGLFVAENVREPSSPRMVALCEWLTGKGIKFSRPEWPYFPYYLNVLIPETRKHGSLWLVYDHRNEKLAQFLQANYLAEHKVESEHRFADATAVLVRNEFVGASVDLIGFRPITERGVMTTNIAFTSDDRYMFVSTKTGQVRWFELNEAGDATKASGECLRLQVRDKKHDAGIFYGGESGLIGMALHPRFDDNHKAYLHYNWQRGDGTRSAIVSEWTVDMSAAPSKVVMRDERQLLVVPQPRDNHNAGCLAFGPDGFLYIAIGDGEEGQWTIGRSPAGTLRGKVLRIDVDAPAGDKPYGIPADNPFVGSDGFPPETWAWGFRNPWRLVFLPDGRLIAGDIGEDVNEEVTFVVKGRHHGWPYQEGLHARNPWTLGDTPRQPPLLPYGRTEGMSVIVAAQYQRDDVPALRGKFVFLDYVSGKIWAVALPESTDTTLDISAAKLVARWPQLVPTASLSHAGRLYFGSQAGRVYLITDADNTQVTAPAAALEPADPAVARSMLGNRFEGPAGPEVGADALALGASLFGDPRLSKDGSRSCASCHRPDRYGQDGLKVAAGGRRNTSTVWGAAHQFAQFHDYRAATVEAAAVESLALHMGHAAAKDVEVSLANVGDYAARFAKAFPDGLKAANVGAAIGAYLRALDSESRWDRFLDGDDGALDREELIGLNEFINNGCTACHMYRGLGGGMPQKLGLMVPWQGADKGRWEVDQTVGQEYFFKVPMLYGVAATGPYYHDGSMATLSEAVANMAKIQLNRDLSAEQVAAIVKFLGALTGPTPELAK